MTDYPLLPTPKPERGKRPRSGWGGGKIVTPSRVRQGQRIGAKFQRLGDAFDNDRDPVSLRHDPLGIAPERAIVFEIAGSIRDFSVAVGRIKGLELLCDEELFLYPDGDFGVLETRAGREPRIRHDKRIAGRLYMAMPNVEALRQLLSLWCKYQAGKSAPLGFKTWFDVFDHLYDLRAWGPTDRVPDNTIAYLKEALASAQADALIRVEVELWYLGTTEMRDAGKTRFRRAMESAGGIIVDQSEIEAIGYLAFLIDLPVEEVQNLIDRDEVNIVVCDDVMLIHPQSTVDVPIEAEPLDDTLPVPTRAVEPLSPIAAIFDAMPVQNHDLLSSRLLLDDPDDYDTMSVVAERRHGTEMASLILHGDRNGDEEPLSRPIYFRPVMYAPGSPQNEQPAPDRLLLDVIYCAVLRMKIGDDEGEPTAPDVFIVNISLGDRNRPFSGTMSPWGRLLDYLAERFGLLFLVSAGNIKTPLRVAKFSGVTDFEAATPEDREAAILSALVEQRAVRTLLSPAEALNVVTVGAWHEDNSPETGGSPLISSPYANAPGPNISSATGLGYHRVVKPDIFMPGGREKVRVDSSGSALGLGIVYPGRRFGLRCAIPDPAGDIRKEGFITGTSAATALATRSSHQIFDALSDPDNGNLFDGIDPAFYAVIVKALLVHRAKWGDLGEALDQTLLPQGSDGTYAVRRDSIAGLLGYGRPLTREAVTCTSNRATMIGYGEIFADGSSALYRIPLPPSLNSTKELRHLTISLAWFSPINIRHQAY